MPSERSSNTMVAFFKKSRSRMISGRTDTSISENVAWLRSFVLRFR
jgi:hypothetical protein